MQWVITQAGKTGLTTLTHANRKMAMATNALQHALRVTRGRFISHKALNALHHQVTLAVVVAADQAVVVVAAADQADHNI
jgi:hypothetical protein